MVMVSTYRPEAFYGRLLWAVAMGGCYGRLLCGGCCGRLLWVVAMGGCHGRLPWGPTYRPDAFFRLPSPPISPFPASVKRTLTPSGIRRNPPR